MFRTMMGMEGQTKKSRDHTNTRIRMAPPSCKRYRFPHPPCDHQPRYRGPRRHLLQQGLVLLEPKSSPGSMSTRSSLVKARVRLRAHPQLLPSSVLPVGGCSEKSPGVILTIQAPHPFLSTQHHLDFYPPNLPPSQPPAPARPLYQPVWLPPPQRRLHHGPNQLLPPKPLHLPLSAAHYINRHQ